MFHCSHLSIRLLLCVSGEKWNWTEKESNIILLYTSPFTHPADSWVFRIPFFQPKSSAPLTMYWSRLQLPGTNALFLFIMLSLSVLSTLKTFLFKKHTFLQSHCPVYIYIQICVCMHGCACMCAYVCVCVCVCVRACVCLCLRVHWILFVVIIFMFKQIKECESA